MTEADLLARFGNPSHSEPDRGFAEGRVSDYEYEGGGIYLRVSAGRVIWVQASSPRYATNRSVRVGTPVLEMKVALGEPQWVNKQEYRDGMGLLYCFVDASGGVLAVAVKDQAVRTISAGGCIP